MQGAQAPNEVVTVHADSFAAGETGTDDLDRAGVGPWLPEGGHEHGTIYNEEIRVAGGHALAFIAEGAGHGELDDVELLAGRGAEFLQTFQILREDGVVLFLGVWLDAGDEAVGFVETGHVVDVTVGVVADYAFAEPVDVGDAEVITQGLLNLVFGQAGVAVGVEQALLAGEQCTLAVDVDGAAFEDHIAHEAAEFKGFFDAGGDFVIEVVGRVFVAPGIVGPVSEGDLAGFEVFNEDGAVVAAPRVVGWVVVEGDAVEACTGAVAEAAGAGVKFFCGVDPDRLEAADGFDDAGEVVGDGPVFSGPSRVVVRPG